MAYLKVSDSATHQNPIVLFPCCSITTLCTKYSNGWNFPVNDNICFGTVPINCSYFLLVIFFICLDIQAQLNFPAVADSPVASTQQHRYLFTQKDSDDKTWLWQSLQWDEQTYQHCVWLITNNSQLDLQCRDQYTSARDYYLSNKSALLSSLTLLYTTHRYTREKTIRGS